MEKRQQREVWTWELVAEFAQRLAPSLVTEEHAGGGLYDEVVLYLPTKDGRTSEADLHARTRIRMNREGRLHVQGGRAAIALDVWSELDAGIPAEDLVDRALDASGRSSVPLAAAGQSPMTTALRAMRTLLARAVARYPGRWEWRMGVHDSSGGYGGVGVRAAWFDGFAQAREDNSPSGIDPFGMSEYRFWFLLHEGVPVLAAQPSAGLLYTTTTRLQAGDSSSITVAKRTLDEVGRALAEQIAGPVEPFKPGQPLPSKALWFTDQADQRLVVVVTEDAAPKAVDKAFAYALAWQHDRDLLLLLPTRRADRVLYRLPWIATPVRVWTISDDSTLRPAVVPARDEVLAHAAAWPVHPGEDHHLGENHAWVSPLLDTVDAHWALTPAHCYSYRAWHCEGLQVLRLKRTGSGIEVRAGVQYSNPKPHQPEPMITTISAPMTPAQRARARSRSRAPSPTA